MRYRRRRWPPERKSPWTAGSDSPTAAKSPCYTPEIFPGWAGQGDLAHKIVAEGGRGFQCLQITGHQQEAVNGGRIALDLGIDHAGVDKGGDGFAVNQRGQTVINLLVRLAKHFPNNIVAAG